MNWIKQLPCNPLPALLAAKNDALVYFTRRDLLGEKPGPVNTLWTLPEPLRYLRRQREDGAWPATGRKETTYPAINRRLYPTYKHLRLLVGKYGFDRDHPAIRRGVDYIFSCQTPEGDIRGILGNQHIPYYNGAILEVVISAGYGDDRRVQKALEWLLSYRLDDGGWTMPILGKWHQDAAIYGKPPLPLDRALPFSHSVTGMVIRAFAAHPGYRDKKAVRAAGELLKGRLFKEDGYGFRRAPHYWTKLQYPFFWTSLLTVLDSLSWFGFSKTDRDIVPGLDWFRKNQADDGLWTTRYEKTRNWTEKDRENRAWVALAVCRMLRRFYATLN